MAVLRAHLFAVAVVLAALVVAASADGRSTSRHTTTTTTTTSSTTSTTTTTTTTTTDTTTTTTTTDTTTTTTVDPRIIYDNSQIATTSGMRSVRLDNESFGYVATYSPDGNIISAVLDKFTVPAGKVWTVESFGFYAFLEGAASFSQPFVLWGLFKGSSMINPQAVVNPQPAPAFADADPVAYRVASDALNSTDRPIYRVRFDTPSSLVLTEGDYFFLITFVFQDDNSTRAYIPPTADLSPGTALQINSEVSVALEPIVDGLIQRRPHIPVTVYGSVSDATTTSTTTSTTVITTTVTTTTTTSTTVTTTTATACVPQQPCDPNVAEQKAAGIHQVIVDYVAAHTPNNNNNNNNRRRRSLADDFSNSEGPLASTFSIDFVRTFLSSPIPIPPKKA